MIKSDLIDCLIILIPSLLGWTAFLGLIWWLATRWLPSSWVEWLRPLASGEFWFFMVLVTCSFVALVLLLEWLAGKLGAGNDCANRNERESNCACTCHVEKAKVEYARLHKDCLLREAQAKRAGFEAGESLMHAHCLADEINQHRSEWKQEGAREALERVDKFIDECADIKEGTSVRITLKQAILSYRFRALADQPEVEGKQAPGVADLALMRGEAPAKADAPRTCALCGKPMPPGEEMFKYHGYSGPCPEPAKADALPLGHEFKRCSSAGCKADHCVRRKGSDVECGQPEAAHGRKK